MSPSSSPRRPGKVEQNMTPMIDVVFQLLAFFVMTFKIATVEGDFNIKMPMPAAGGGDSICLPIRVTVTATATGDLATLRLGDLLMRDFEHLHQELRSLVGDGGAAGSSPSQMEVELDCDSRLHYTNVIRTITAVSGRRTAHGTIEPLIEKVRFVSRDR